ncbi:protein-export chaperone SecB [Brevundimonas balnearis]|uniref:Protein-export protein SecB n=1 Tax=Brevundimonas balnearis TaxID=1572858 RepID=A0ABV6R3D1_9CAUL
MTDVPADTTATPTDGAANGQAGTPPAPGYRVLAQYVRDLSFENPRAPDSLRVDGKPAIDMGVEMSAQGRPDNLFEVDIKLSIKASHADQALFHVELVYGGLFQLQGVREQDIEPMLLVECPRYLFPFAREIIAKQTADGGFYPPLMLEPLDFAAIYIARRQQAAQAAQLPGAPAQA